MFLHYAFDLWFQKKWHPSTLQGEGIVVRYVDDVVVRFQYRQDVDRYLMDVRNRLAKYDLDLHPEKTRIVEFGRFTASDRKDRGERRPETCEFFGFVHFCTRIRKGGFRLGRKPASKRIARTLKRIGEILRKRMHWDIWDVGKWLGKVLGLAELLRRNRNVEVVGEIQAPADEIMDEDHSQKVATSQLLLAKTEPNG